MFFIGGISSKSVKLDFNQPMICFSCGRYGSFQVYMEYIYISIFFIPLFKWNKKYYVKSSCCNNIYSISNELGRRIEKGDNITLKEEDLHLFQKGLISYGCPNCGFIMNTDYNFCPNCGEKHFLEKKRRK